MKASPNIDTVFNFYVTAYHVKNYVEVQFPALEAALVEEFKTDRAFQMCGYICNKGKHLKLTHRPWKDYPFKTRRKLGAVADKMVANQCYANEGPSYRLVVDGEETDVIALGQEVLDKWEVFFKNNGI